MSVSVNDPIVAKSRGSVQQTLDYVTPHGPQRVTFLTEFLNTLWTVCNSAGVDYLIVAAHAVHETDFFTSSWWVNRGNPSGLGVTGDPTQDAASPTFATGTQAARADAAHFLLYATGQINAGGLTPSDDPRFAAYRDAYGTKAMATTIQGLGGTWAADVNEPTGVANHANAILAVPIVTPAPGAGGGTPVPDLNMTGDLIPLPSMIVKIITDAQNSAWDDLGPKTVKGFVLHRQLGTNDGTDQYFRTMGDAHATGAGGLTEFGQRASGGELFLWNSPLGFGGGGASPNRAPWASGVFNVHGDAYGDGLAFVNKYGLNAVNGAQVAWEIDGFYGDPWSDAAQDEAAQACAHYAHNYGISHVDFPIAPQDGFSFVRWHQELTGPAEKICPGPVVMNATPAWIEKVRAIMKTAQTAATVPVTPNPPPKPSKYAKPVPIKTASDHVIPYTKSLTATVAYTPRQVASDTGAPTAAESAVGSVVRPKWLVLAEDQSIWFCTAGGSYHAAWAFFAPVKSHQ